MAYYATTNTLLQLLVPTRMRGRVMSLYILSSTGFMPVGNLIVGPVADRIGVQAALAGCAMITIGICGAVALRARSVRDLHATRLAPQP